ncbi:uncharacterized protein LOC141790071 [Halichoeres trimaculatus]|uniref:uncharacterized protein LOC141790071 n=1 Tax=Halichoeres trimaculatus TaxID=147232 RepID=UPI003D9E44F7
MGQNQGKQEGGEPAESEGLENARPNPDSGDVVNPTGDVMEGGSSCEAEVEEDGSTRKNLGEPDAQGLDGSPGQEPTTPSSEKHINLWISPLAAREVRQGGAAKKEEGGGGEGGRIVPLVPQETDKNLKSSEKTEERANTNKPFKGVKREKKEELRISSKVKMENQEEVTILLEERQEKNSSAGVLNERCDIPVSSEDAESFNFEEDSGKVKMSRFGAHAGRELLRSVKSDHRDTMVDEDIKLCARTVGRLTERKEPPTAQQQHPLENSVQKESLLDMSDTIQGGPPKMKTELNTKEEMPTCEVRPALDDYSLTIPKVTDTGDQRHLMKPHSTLDTSGDSTSQSIDLDQASNPASPREPSSILEKLLKRNRKDAVPDLSEMKEVYINEKDTSDGTAKMIIKSAATEPSTDQIHHSEVITPLSACDIEELENIPAKKQQINASDSATSDVLCFQPEMIGNTTRLSSLTTPHHSKADWSEEINSRDDKLKKEVEIKLNVSPPENPPSERLLSSVSHERASTEQSYLITEESASLSVSNAKSHSSKSDDSVHVNTSEITDNNTAGLPLLIECDSTSKAEQESSGSTSLEAQPVRTRREEDSTKDTVQAVETGSVLVEASTAIPEEKHQVPDMKQDLHTTPNKGNTMPEQPDKKPADERGDTVVRRIKSQSTPRTRPVSDLIKESVQLHEKLQHQDWPKPAEVKCDDQGQSVKVAQMKAAFDSAQKSPEKGIERKPSMRKGRCNMWLLACI